MGMSKNRLQDAGVTQTNHDSVGHSKANSMWGGRFAEGPDALMARINASIGFDQKMYAQDIAGSLAHAEMLRDTGIISADDHAAIASGLETIRG